MANTAPTLRFVVVLITAILFAGCVATQDPLVTTEPASSKSAAVESAFDMNSWQTIIGDECRSFFDGCNNCFRVPGKMAACTRKACSAYQSPRCLDDTQAANSEQQAVAKLVEYVCAGDKRFSVSYHEFVQDDQRVRLKASEIMFSDHQTRRVYRLQRVPSASGEQYVDPAGFKFFAKGNEALVMQKDSRLYSSCSQQR